jgi:urea transport system permease protein
MSLTRLLGALLPVLAALVVAGAATAADLATLVTNLVTGGYSDRDAAITALAASGEARAAPILQALGDGALYVRSADKVVVIAKDSGKKLALTDAITGKDAGTATEDDLEKVKINNRLRGTLDAAMGTLTLMNPDPTVRRDAARALFTRREASSLEALDKAMAAE